MFSFMEMPPSNRSPYSRADWTELQLQFRPPRDGRPVSIRLRDYASPEEIDVVIAALQLRWRELGACARGANRTATRRMSAAAQDAALAAMCGPARTGAGLAGSSGICARTSSTTTTATMPRCCRCGTFDGAANGCFRTRSDC